MKTLIIGQARSGSTALFLRLQAHLPAHGLAFFEPDAFQMPATGHVLVKSLVMSLPEDVKRASLDASAFDHRLVLVRDPRDRLISVLLFLLHWHTPAYPPLWQCAPADLEAILCLLRQKEQAPASISVAHVFERVLWTRFGFPPQRAWATWYRLQAGFFAFLATLPDYIPIFYESLMMADQGLPPRAYASIRRHATVGEWQQWFTPADIDYFRPLLLPYMERFGYADDWTLPTAQTIDPQYSSRYVEKWVRVSRRAVHVAPSA